MSLQLLAIPEQVNIDYDGLLKLSNQSQSQDKQLLATHCRSHKKDSLGP